MLVIRLTRKGKKNQPFFRVVVIDKRRSAKGGRPSEILGYVNPLTKRKSLKKERILHWIKNGAQPSPTVHNLLVSEKIIEAKKINKSKKPKKVAPAVAQAPASGQVAPNAPIAPATQTAPAAEVTPPAPEVAPVAEKPAENLPAPVSEKPQEKTPEAPAESASS